jgi:hypothetical protein
VTSAIRRKVLGDLFEARMKLLTGVTIYRGEIPTDPPAIPDDPSGRVAPYVVIFGSAGSPDIDPDLGDENDDLLWTAHLICSAGWEADAQQLIDRIHSHIYRWSPTTTGGVSFGRLRPPPGYDPGPVRCNETVKPPRFWSPLQYQLPLTAN